MSKTKEAIMDAEYEHENNNGVHVTSSSSWCRYCKDEERQLTREKRIEEADGRDRDIAEGWEPHHS